MRKRIDLTGKEFGRLVVVAFSHKSKNRNSYWYVRCVCGENIKTVSGDSLKNGRTKSCGCMHKSLISTHGLTLTPAYKSWQQMKDRCSNPNSQRYRHYGGRGITVCARWLDSFQNFHEDMGDKPEGLTLERKDNDGNYEPSNCKWATPREQANNKQTSRIIKHNGLSLTVAQWAGKLNINERTLRGRLRKGFPIEKVFRKTLLNAIKQVK